MRHIVNAAIKVAPIIANGSIEIDLNVLGCRKDAPLRETIDKSTDHVNNLNPKYCITLK